MAKNPLTMLGTAQKEKQAANSSLERIRRSIEGALEKEKKSVEKAAVNQYIRDASLRMEMNLPIKPSKKPELPPENKKKRPDYRLPSLNHADKSKDKCNEPAAETEQTAGRFTSMSLETHQSASMEQTPKLPPIVIDTGQRMRGAKRKHKDNHNKKDTTSRRIPTKTARSHSDDGSLSDDAESLNVVLCGRSTLPSEDSGYNKELYVSKHGRFKSK